MSSVRTIITLAIPAVTALFGLLWFFGKKKPPTRKKVNKDDGNDLRTGDQISNSAAELVVKDCYGNCNNSAESDNEWDDWRMQPSDSSTKSETKPVIVEQIVPIVDSTLKSETVTGMLTEPVKASVPVTEHPTVNAVSDSLMSQIIVTDTDYTDMDFVSSKDNSKLAGKDNGNGSNENEQSRVVCEEVVSKVDDSFNISQEAVKAELSDTKQTVKVNVVPERNSEINQLQKLNGSECDITEESSTLMSRSWHQDVEESEQISNGLFEQNENVTNNVESVEEQNAALINHTGSTSIPVKRDNHSSSKERSSMSPQSKNSSPVSRSLKKLRDESLNHSETSSNCDNSSEVTKASNDSGKGGSVGDSLASHADEDKVFEFNIPSDMCGLFIGTRGKTIKQIRDQSGARIRLKNNPYTRDFQICVVEGTEDVINRACKIIKRKFPSLNIPGIDATAVSNTVIMPEIMQLSLPESVSIDVVVSSIVDAGRLFVQQPTHPSFPSLERLNSFMNQCYHHDGAVPDIPKPIESGVICAAPMLNGWYRAQIMVYYEDTDECDLKYVDYGGYSRISSRCLKQIRSDFMTLPFEAVECYLANVTPLDSESYFSQEAAVVLEELTQGKMLQAQVVGKAEDGIPYVHIYQISGPNQTLLVNRELVNRGVVRWLELLS